MFTFLLDIEENSQKFGWCSSCFLFDLEGKNSVPLLEATCDGSVPSKFPYLRTKHNTPKHIKKAETCHVHVLSTLVCTWNPMSLCYLNG